MITFRNYKQKKIGMDARGQYYEKQKSYEILSLIVFI